jgi:hypothetical protein
MFLGYFLRQKLFDVAKNGLDFILGNFFTNLPGHLWFQNKNVASIVLEM